MKLENPLDILLKGGSIYRALEVKAMKGLMGLKFKRLLDVGCGGNHYLRAEEYHTADINPKSNPTLCFDANSDWIGAVDGTIVAAGAVVNRSFPPYSIIGGVPARLLGERK